MEMHTERTTRKNIFKRPCILMFPTTFLDMCILDLKSGPDGKFDIANYLQLRCTLVCIVALPSFEVL